MIVPLVALLLATAADNTSRTRTRREISNLPVSRQAVAMISWLADKEKLPQDANLEMDILEKASREGFLLSGGVLTLVGDVAIRLEPWCPRCVEEGLLGQEGELGGEDYNALDGDEPLDRKPLYEREREMRKKLPEADNDAPPRGFPVLVASIWKTCDDPRGEYDFVEIQVWARR